MKWHRIGLAVLALPLLFAAGMASADRGGHGYNSHGYNHGQYARHSGYYGNYYRGSGHRRHRGSNEGAYLLGGLVVGSLLTNAWHNSYSEPVYVQRSSRVYVEPPVREIIYTQEPTRIVSGAPAAVSGRHLYRDIDGNCFERMNDAQGNELLSELPADDCRW